MRVAVAFMKQSSRVGRRSSTFQTPPALGDHASKFASIVGSTRAAARFAKPQAKNVPDMRDIGGSSHTQFVTLKSMMEQDGKRLWRSHIAQKKKIMHRILHDQVKKERVVQEWMDHSQQAVIRCRNGRTAKLADLKAMREWYEEVARSDGMVDFDSLSLDGDETDVPPCVVPMREEVRIFLASRAPGSKYMLRTRKVTIMNVPGVRRRFLLRVFTFEDLLASAYPDIAQEDLGHLAVTATRLSSNAKTLGRKTTKKHYSTPERTAGQLFRLADEQHRGGLTLEQLEQFFGKVFKTHPVTIVMQSIDRETRERIQETGDTLGKEEFVFWYTKLYRACNNPPRGTPLDDFYRTDPISQLREYAEEKSRIALQGKARHSMVRALVVSRLSAGFIGAKES